jgi:hypothetical protein
MTNAKLEIAVYQYCGLMGIDPHEDVKVESEFDVLMYEKRFHVVKRMIESHWAVTKSIEFAMNPPKEDL